jgi:hypothetical protein
MSSTTRRLQLPSDNKPLLNPLLLLLLLLLLLPLLSLSMSRKGFPGMTAS